MVKVFAQHVAFQLYVRFRDVLSDARPTTELECRRRAATLGARASAGSDVDVRAETACFSRVFS